MGTPIYPLEQALGYNEGTSNGAKTPEDAFKEGVKQLIGEGRLNLIPPYVLDRRDLTKQSIKDYHATRAEWASEVLGKSIKEGLAGNENYWEVMRVQRSLAAIVDENSAPNLHHSRAGRRPRGQETKKSAYKACCGF